MIIILLNYLNCLVGFIYGDRIKCYSYHDCTEELINYFKTMYLNDNCDHEVIMHLEEVCIYDESIKLMRLY